MPQRSNIHGAEYTFLEWVPSLDDGKQYILCVDDAGHRVICSESLWNSGVWQKISAPATALMCVFSLQSRSLRPMRGSWEADC